MRRYHRGWLGVAVGLTAWAVAIVVSLPWLVVTTGNSVNAASGAVSAVLVCWVSRPAWRLARSAA